MQCTTKYDVQTFLCFFSLLVRLFSLSNDCSASTQNKTISNKNIFVVKKGSGSLISTLLENEFQDELQLEDFIGNLTGVPPSRPERQDSYTTSAGNENKKLTEALRVGNAHSRHPRVLPFQTKLLRQREKKKKQTKKTHKPTQPTTQRKLCHQPDFFPFAAIEELSIISAKPQHSHLIVDDFSIKQCCNICEQGDRNLKLHNRQRDPTRTSHNFHTFPSKYHISRVLL